MTKKPDFIVDKNGVVYDVRDKYYPKTDNFNSGNNKQRNVAVNNVKATDKKETEIIAAILIPIFVIIALIGSLLGIFGNNGKTAKTNNINLMPEDEYYNYSRACHLFLQGDYLMAHFYINMVISSSPNNSQAYNISGLIYFKENKYEKALVEFNKGLELAPNSPDIFNNRGITYYAMEKYDESLLDFNEVILINGNNAKAFYNRGLVYVAKEMYNEAIIDLSKAIEISSSNPINVLQQTMTIKKSTAQLFGDIRKEMEFYQTDINIAAAYYQRGLVLLILGNEEKGNADINKALTMGYTIESSE